MLLGLPIVGACKVVVGLIVRLHEPRNASRSLYTGQRARGARGWQALDPAAQRFEVVVGLRKCGLADLAREFVILVGCGVGGRVGGEGRGDRGHAW